MAKLVIYGFTCERLQSAGNVHGTGNPFSSLQFRIYVQLQNHPYKQVNNVNLISITHFMAQDTWGLHLLCTCISILNKQKYSLWYIFYSDINHKRWGWKSATVGLCLSMNHVIRGTSRDLTQYIKLSVAHHGLINTEQSR